MLMCFNRVELYSEKMENSDDDEIIFLNYFLTIIFIGGNQA